MHWMSGGLLARIWRFIDKHGVHCPNIRTCKAFDHVQDLGVYDKLRKLIVPYEVLNFIENAFVGHASAVLERDVPHHGDATFGNATIDQIQKSLLAMIRQIIRYQFGDDYEPILFVEFSLSHTQSGIIQGKLQALFGSGVVIAWH